MVDIASLLTVKFFALVGLATLFAVLVYKYAPDKSTWGSLEAFVEDVAIKFIAAFLVAWAAMEAGTDIYGLYGFLSIVAGALGGILVIQALLASSKNYLTPPSAPGPPAA
jgi:hypothetical protein